MMAVRGAVQTVHRFGRDRQRGVEPKSHVSQRDIVVDCLGQGDDVQSLFFEMQRVFLRRGGSLPRVGFFDGRSTQRQDSDRRRR